MSLRLSTTLGDPSANRPLCSSQCPPAHFWKFLELLRKATKCSLGCGPRVCLQDPPACWVMATVNTLLEEAWALAQLVAPWCKHQGLSCGGPCPEGQRELGEVAPLQHRAAGSSRPRFVPRRPFLQIVSSRSGLQPPGGFSLMNKKNTDARLTLHVLSSPPWKPISPQSNPVSFPMAPLLRP